MFWYRFELIDILPFPIKLTSYMERGHERLNSPKTLHSCLGKNPLREIKEVKDLNIIPKSHQFSMLRFFFNCQIKFSNLK